MDRRNAIAAMASETCDVLVIGGGIVGAGIAWDAALRGLRVALVERSDFASGTSGRTSRLIHGGLRYLRKFRVGLVRTAARERDRLLANAPGLVRPLRFLVPTRPLGSVGTATLRFGLWLYDALSKEGALPRRRIVRGNVAKELEPKLDGPEGPRAGVYYDALANDARLVLEVVRAAATAGAGIANHVEVTGVRPEDSGFSVRMVDALASRELVCRARVVVNATGVWSDRTRRLVREGGPNRIHPTKGIHVFVPRERIGNHEAVVLRAKRDGRVLFVLPWGRLSLVGTTDTTYAGPLDAPIASAGDVGYLLESVNEAFPDAHLTPEDVVSSYAGLRPLLAAKPGSESDVSRAHAWFDDGGMISVAGGKLTTFRVMAAEVVDVACQRLGVAPRTRTERERLGPVFHLDEIRQGVMAADRDIARRLLSTYHDEALARYLEGDSRAFQRIDPALPFTWGEVRLVAETEMAMTLEDVLVRRLSVFYEMADQGRSVATAVALLVGAAHGWDQARITSEVEAYGRLIDESRSFRGERG